MSVLIAALRCSSPEFSHTECLVFRTFIYVLYLDILSTCVPVYSVGVLWRPDEGVKILGTTVRDGCAPPCGCWEPTQVLYRSSKDS